MAEYGNSKGKNSGKKYIKLRGDETATPDALANGAEFLTWYAQNISDLRKRIYAVMFDEDVFSDTAIRMYDSIVFKGTVIRDYRFYFLRAYHTAHMAQRAKPDIFVSIDDLLPGQHRLTYRDVLPDSSDSQYDEVGVDKLRSEMLNYVRLNYPPYDCSLFEIYIGLQPEVSYKTLSGMLGLPLSRVWPILGAIRKDLIARFGDDYNVLSLD